MTKRESKPVASAPVVLGLAGFAAISAIEGLQLTSEGRKRVEARSTPEERRAAVREFYSRRK